jgi:hypothetical protein
LDEHGASNTAEDATLEEEVEQLADGRTIRFFTWEEA